jgi:hypothetical protein
MTYAFMKPRPQWRVLNVLHQHTELGRPRASVVLDRADASPDDLADLDQARLVEGWYWTRATGVAVRTDVDLANVPAAELGRTLVALTPAGRSWVGRNPHNRVLTAAGTYPTAPALHTAVTDYGLSFDALVACAHAGLITVTDDHLGAITPTVAVYAHAVALRIDSARLALTPTGLGTLCPG